MGDRAVGRVVSLWRYPVKSMAAEPLAEVYVSWNGLAGDRRWAFLQAGKVRSGFPWMTIRELAEMRRYLPSFVDPAEPNTSAVVVRAPSGESFDVADPALAARLGDGVRVLKQDRGAFDTMPLSLLTTQTLARMAALVGAPLDAQRFRPNLLVDVGDGAPFVEDAWVGRELRVGALRMRVDKRDGRCLMVNLDPVTDEPNPAVLRTIGRERQGCLGVYGTTVEPGRVAVGDLVTVDA